MALQVHLRDGVAINCTPAVPDVGHDANDPNIIVIKDGVQILYWIDINNFDYAQAV